MPKTFSFIGCPNHLHNSQAPWVSLSKLAALLAKLLVLQIPEKLSGSLFYIGIELVSVSLYSSPAATGVGWLWATLVSLGITQAFLSFHPSRVWYHHLDTRQPFWTQMDKTEHSQAKLLRHRYQANDKWLTVEEDVGRTRRDRVSV